MDAEAAQPSLGLGPGDAVVTPDRTTILEPHAASRQYFQDVWIYRELLVVFAWRDITVRYRQAVVGVGWAVLRPLLTTAIFTMVFGRIADLPSAGSAPYPVVIFAGMLPWFLFAAMLGDGSNSLVNNASLIGKVYFPRLVLPLASGVVALVDFCVSFLVFLGFLWWFEFVPSPRILALPIFILWAVLAAIGPVLLLSSLTVQYRDFRQIVPFLIQVGIYISPVGYLSSVVPDEWRAVYSLNPLVGAIDGFRWCILGSAAPLYPLGMVTSAATVLLMLLIGLWYFHRTERGFADVL